MKKQTLTSFGLSLVFMIAAIFSAVTPALANDDFGARVIYSVPFDFYVGNDKMAAGKYEIQRVSDTVYQIRDAESTKSVFVPAQLLTGSGKGVKTAKLVFNQYGQQHFLREIYTQVRASGRVINESKTERRIRKERESENNLAKAKPITVEIAAQ